nr:MFS transporter [Streptomyces melanosporofaciens]
MIGGLLTQWAGWRRAFLITVPVGVLDVHGYSPPRAGLGYLPVGVATFAGAQSGGPLSIRIGARRAALLCCALGASGFAGVALGTGLHASYPVSVLLPGAVFGFGTAAAFTPITAAATGGLPPDRTGLAAGLLNTVGRTSGALGPAVLSTLAPAVGYTAVFAVFAVFAVSAGCLAAAVAAAPPLLIPRGP